MSKTFDRLIESFLENKIGIVENFLSQTLASDLKKNIQTLHEKKQFSNASIGNETSLQQNKLIRSDEIYWLDRTHQNLHENLFLDQMDAFIHYLNSTCFTGINDYEFHYTMYKPGDFYTKHFDQFQNKDSRKYSMVIYLNSNWHLSHGGELCIHHDNFTQKIAPTNRKAVFFDSKELAHEVLVTHINRLSITGWLKVI